ncbi:MAG: Uma2 family endonuclease [Tunicatimonas sp.]
MTTVAEKPSRKNKKAERKAISLEAFKKKYLEKITYKYEWKDGQVEKEEYMKASERYIINNIVTKYNTLSDYQEGNRIMGEADCYLSAIGAYRRPDAAYLTKEQINYPETASEAPALVIEVSSPSNSSEQNINKMLEYFEAGTRVVWYIYPEQKQVWVYTNPKEVTICHEGDVCSADPAISGFSINVSDLFSRSMPKNK